MEHLTDILQHFDLPQGTPSVSGNFSGLINQTLKLTYEKESFIFQQINLHVFPNCDQLMENVLSVTRHIYQKTGGGMRVVLTKDGAPYWRDGDRCYRIYTFIENSISFDTVDDDRIFYRAGKGFGKFQRDLADFPAEKLYEVIPDFHNTVKRFSDFEQAVAADSAGRVAEAMPEIEFLKANRALSALIWEPLCNGEIPMRVTHNDTKLNNILFDRDTSEPVCVIDLDTVMSGSVLFDFGDAVRYGANRVGETPERAEDAKMDMALFEAFSKGFLSETGDVLTPAEIRLLPDSVAVMTYELALRFLEDYLRGDVYFGAATPTLNLHRARVQIRLLQDILEKIPQMREITEKMIG